MLIADLASLWGKVVVEFLKSLRDVLQNSLLMVIALPSEYPFIYDSNVLVVVDDDKIDVVRKVLSVKRDVEKMFDEKVVINPLIVTKKEERIIDAFRNMVHEPLPDKDIWRRAIKEFSSKLNDVAIEVIGLAPDEQLYDSNVLVIVQNDDINVIKRVLSVKRDVEKMFDEKVVINPLIVTKKEERIIDAFKSRNTTK